MSTSMEIRMNAANGNDTPFASLNSQLDVELIRVDQMSPDLTAKWSSVRQDALSLNSPYFDLEFAKCVARVRDDVEIAVIRAKSSVVGFFPFQRVGRYKSLPVGGLMNDYHGIVGPAELTGRLPEILRKCNLKSWQYHAGEGTANCLSDYDFEQLPCPYIDLSKGYQHYEETIKKQSKTMRRQKQKTSKMLREVGQLRLEYDCRDDSVLSTLIAWKREKYQRTKTFDILSVDWTAELLHEVFRTKVDNFGGVLSALWAGDNLVAAHMGISTDTILHYWFPVINVEFGKYSPGTQMFLQIAEEAASQNIEMIDLGYGDDGFKSKWTTHRKYVGRGKVEFGRVRHAVSRTAYRARIAAKSMPFKEATKTVLRKVWPGFGGRAFR